MSDNLQLLIAIVILIGFSGLVWRGGRANPVGTGALQRQLNTIGSKVEKLATRLDSSCSTEDLAKLRAEVERIEAAGASSIEIVALEGKINVLAERIEGWGGATRRIEGMLQRIEGNLVKKALGGD